MTTLRIFIAQHQTSYALPSAWVLFDSLGSVLRQGEDALNHLPVADNTELVVPAEWVSLVKCTLPAGNRKRLQEALPYLVEDHVIANPDEIHVVIAQSINTTEAMLASINKETLKNLIHTFNQKQLDIQSVVPATVCTSLQAQTWHLVLDTQTNFLRTASCGGFALELDEASSPPLALTMALAQSKQADSAPQELVIDGNQSHLVSQHVEAWSKQLGIPVVLSKRDWKLTPPSNSMNLLQGHFAPKPQILAWLLQVKPALIMLASIVVISLIGSCIDWARYAFEKHRLDSEMNALFMHTFPDAGNIVNAPLQMQRKLDEMRHANGDANSTDFLQLLAHISSHVGSLGQISTMHYENGEISLSMQANNAAAANALAQKILVPGRIAVVENIKPNAKGVDFQLVFKADGE